MRGGIIQVLKKYPHIHKLMQFVYWKVREAKARILGTKIEEKKWSKMHLNKGEGWIRECWESKRNPHRQFVLSHIVRYAPFTTVLKVGCNYGPNLYNIAKFFPDVEARGVDINPVVVEKGNGFFADERMTNVRLSVGVADDLSEFGNRIFDIVLTDAGLLYIGPDKILKVIRELFRVARRSLILVEWHCGLNESDPVGLGIYYKGYWKRNYLKLLRPFANEECISLTKIPEEIWPTEGWKHFGYVIEVNLQPYF
jgi:SAM-dependent methyltransferase